MLDERRSNADLASRACCVLTAGGGKLLLLRANAWQLIDEIRMCEYVAGQAWPPSRIRKCAPAAPPSAA
eukprot:6178176-Pleurochrysis_carterae.AAC.1